MQKEMY